MDFFRLSVNDKKRGLQVVNCASEDAESLVRGKSIGKDAIKLDRLMGSKEPGNVVEIPASTFAITPELMAQISKYGLTGLVFQEAVLSSHNYQILGFSGVCGPINHNSTSKGDLCSDDFIYVRGINIDLNTWDGLDCFVPEGTLFLLVSQQARSRFQDIFGDWLLYTPLEDVTFYSPS